MLRGRARRLLDLIGGHEGQLVRGHRSTDVVALGQVAAQLAQEVECLHVLDAFGHDPQTHVVAQLDRRAHEFEVELLAGAGQAHDEGLIEFELADREAAEVGERREAGAEVVNRHHDAEVAQGFDHGLGAGEILDDRRFGDLDDERLAGKVVAMQQVDDQFGESRLEQVGGGDVDRHGQHAAVRAPTRALGHRLAQHPRREVVHQTRVFGEGEEFDRGDQTEAGVRPTDQRFDRQYLAGAQIQLGLVVQDELALFHGLAQLFDERQLLLAAVDVLVVEDVRDVAQLGAVHGGVRAPHQPDAFGGVLGGEGDADTRADLGAHLLQVEGLDDLGDDALGDAGRRVGVGVDEQHRQFVTAEAKDRSGRRDGPHQARTQLTQQFVTGGMAEGVVDLLEVVQVDVEEGEGALLRPRVVEVREVGLDHV